MGGLRLTLVGGDGSVGRGRWPGTRKRTAGWRRRRFGGRRRPGVWGIWSSERCPTTAWRA
eukprot:3241121-Pyramimonas_sp.AAC.1